MPILNILKYLKLQPLEPTDDGTTSPLDEYEQDETIDLNSEIDEVTLDEEWNTVINDLKQDPEKLTFSDK
jgi:hypothetical protein